MQSLLSKPVGEVVDAIIAAMRREAYSDLTVRLSARCLAHLRCLCGAFGGSYTRLAGARFAADTVSPRTGRHSEQRRKMRGRLARLADSYLEDGVVDLAVVRRPVPGPSSEAFQVLLASWETRMRADRWADETVSQHAGYARRFLVYLEGLGCSELSQAPAGAVAGFFSSLAGQVAPGSMRTVGSVARAFTVFACREDMAEAVRLVGFQRRRATSPVLSDADLAAVAEVAGSGSVTARDAAITMLAVFTGLRACDICALGLGDIDWRAGSVSLVQAKTGNPLTLPLPPAVGNATARYLLEERPVTASRCVFVRSLAPYAALSGHSSIRCAIKRVFDQAGIAPRPLGTRLTRHSAASRMLAAGVPHPTISAVLGHADPASVDAYLDTDAEAMRQCVLPLPQAARP